MTQHLETLKGILQHEFTKTHMSRDYVEALGDALYACSLGEAALNVLIYNWTHEDLKDEGLSPENFNYKKGVQFVAEQWDRILSEGNEGEE